MIEIKNLCAGYGKSTVIDNICLHAENNSITTILGKNGAGKTTLLNCISENIKFRGSIEISGKGELSQRLSFLRQNLPSPHIKVRELVSFGRNPYLGFSKKLSNNDKKIVEQAMERTRILPLADCFVDEISGGEKQKAYISMILAQETPNIILDEPMAHLDNGSAGEIQTILNEASKNKTIIIVSHDIISSLKNSQKIIVLDNGKVAFRGTAEECIDSNILKKVFGVDIISFSDKNDQYYCLK